MKIVSKTLLVLSVFCTFFVSYSKCPHCNHICNVSCIQNENSECISHACNETSPLIEKDDTKG